MKTVKTELIICQTKPMFERDIMIEAFSPNLGKIKCLAKNAQGKSKRFNGKLEVTNYLQCELYKGKSFLLLNDCEMQNGFLSIRDRYNTIILACFCIDVIRHATQFNQRNRALFDLMLDTLSKIDKGDKGIADIQEEFQFLFLKNEGLIDGNRGGISFFDFKKTYEAYSHIPLNKPRYLAN